MIQPSDIIPQLAAEQEADPELAAELLTAMTGINPQRAPSEIELSGARNYIARIRRRIVAFLEAKKAEPIKWTRPPSQKALMANLLDPFDPDEVAEWSIDLPVAVSFNWPITVQRAKDYVLAKWPKFEDTSLGLHDHELAPDEYGDVWHLFRTLNDPETIFNDLDSMVLLPEQVESLAAVYPKLNEIIRKIIGLLIIPYIEVQGAAKKQKHLTAEREEQLRVLLGIPNDAPIQVQQEEKKRPPTRKAEGEREYDYDSQLPSEHVAQARTAKG